MQRRLTLVSMSGLRVGHERLAQHGLRLPGLARRATALSQLPPLGLLTIAAMVPENWDVTLLSDDGKDPVESTVGQIFATRPDLVAFSSLTPAVDRAAQISAAVRRHKIKTVIGGLHATADPGFCRQHFDVVATGDGEETIARLLSDWSQDRLQPHYHPVSPFDLSRAPLPRWDLLGSNPPPRYTLQTVRGCPWACSFCAASRLLGPARAKPIDRIQEELNAITNRQTRPWLELADDNTFAVDRDHQPILESLRDCGARWFTESDWRIALQPRLLQQLAGSGCRQILIGFESHVFRYPGMGAKTADLERLVEAAQTIQEAGIVVNACFIVGADGETEASIERLGDFLETAPFGEIQLTLQTPFPGTSLYQSLRRCGRLLTGDFSRYTLFDVVYKPDRMTPEQLQSQFTALIQRVFRHQAQERRDKMTRMIRRHRRQGTN
jgi:radical SAM superfamily enzyme YgiQ (UPF0313 family)